MSEQANLRTWIGKQIAVVCFHGNGVAETEGTLRALGDHGLLVETRDEVLWHYPWSSVQRFGGIRVPAEG